MLKEIRMRYPEGSPILEALSQGGYFHSQVEKGLGYILKNGIDDKYEHDMDNIKNYIKIETSNVIGSITDIYIEHVDKIPGADVDIYSVTLTYELLGKYEYMSEFIGSSISQVYPRLLYGHFLNKSPIILCFEVEMLDREAVTVALGEPVEPSRTTAEDERDNLREIKQDASDEVTLPRYPLTRLRVRI